VYDTSGSQVVTAGTDVTFDSNGPLSGVTHTAGTAAVTVPIAGTYQIYYAVNITAGTGATISIAVNGTVDASTSIDLLSATGETSGDTMLTLAAGDVLTLRNSSVATPFTTSTTNVGAQLDVILLS
jgi:hypothetical protein